MEQQKIDFMVLVHKETGVVILDWFGLISANFRLFTCLLRNSMFINCIYFI